MADVAIHIMSFVENLLAQEAEAEGAEAAEGAVAVDHNGAGGRDDIAPGEVPLTPGNGDIRNMCGCMNKAH